MISETNNQIIGMRYRYDRGDCADRTSVLVSGTNVLSGWFWKETGAAQGWCFISCKTLPQKINPSMAVCSVFLTILKGNAWFWFLNNGTHKHAYLHWARQFPGCLWCSCWQIIKDSKLLCELKGLWIKLPTVPFDLSTLSWWHSLEDSQAQDIFSCIIQNFS